MAKDGHINIMAVAISASVSDATVKRLANIPLRVIHGDIACIVACFKWLASVSETIIEALSTSGNGQGLNLPLLPSSVTMIQCEITKCKTRTIFTQ